MCCDSERRLKDSSHRGSGGVPIGRTDRSSASNLDQTKDDDTKVFIMTTGGFKDRGPTHHFCVAAVHLLT